MLGPILFLVLLGDIDEKVSSSFVSSFADDTRVGRIITNTDDVKTLQKDLETIYHWSRENNMQFNSSKFECIRYGNNETLKLSTQYLGDTGQSIEVKDCTAHAILV